MLYLIMIGIMQSSILELIFFGSKMCKSEQNRLTNQPDICSIPSIILSRVLGVLASGVGAVCGI